MASSFIIHQSSFIHHATHGKPEVLVGRHRRHVLIGAEHRLRKAAAVRKLLLGPEVGPFALDNEVHVLVGIAAEQCGKRIIVAAVAAELLGSHVRAASERFEGLPVFFRPCV